MNNYNYILSDVLYQDLGIHVYDMKYAYISGKKTIILFATPISNSSEYICPECNSNYIRKNGYYIRTVKHLPLFGYNCIIKLKQLRLRCMDCNKSFNENCKLVAKSKVLSSLLKLKVIENIKTKESFQTIGNELGISSTSVLKIFNDNVYVDRKTMSRVICIDEFSADTEYGKYALSIGNPETGDILDILPSRTQEYIYHYFNNISLEERNKVKFVITDLCESYRSVVRSLFFKSIHIADRFHWIKLTTNAFNSVRIRVMKDFQKKINETKDWEERAKLSQIYRLMKSFYKVFLANKYRKEGTYYTEELNKKLYDKHVTRQEILEIIFNSSLEIDNAYWLLQDLYKISIFSSFDSFYKDINEWFDKVREANINEFKKVMNTYRDWFKEIRNSFIIDDITKKRLTNGFIEGKNNISKVIKRIGFGYKKFDNLRNRILYSNKELAIKG